MLLAYRDNKDPTEIIESAAELIEIREPDIGVEGHIAACYLLMFA